MKSNPNVLEEREIENSKNFKISKCNNLIIVIPNNPWNNTHWLALRLNYLYNFRSTAQGALSQETYNVTSCVLLQTMS
jgi:hypothetical protein